MSFRESHKFSESINKSLCSGILLKKEQDFQKISKGIMTKKDRNHCSRVSNPVITHRFGHSLKLAKEKPIYLSFTQNLSTN